jgi:hypothetical protein
MQTHADAYRPKVPTPRPTAPELTPSLAYVSIRQHTSAYVSIRAHTDPRPHPPRHCARVDALSRIRQHTSAYVSIRQHTCAYRPTLPVSIRQHTSAYVSIRAHTDPRLRPRTSVSIRQHTSACVSIRAHTDPRPHPPRHCARVDALSRAPCVLSSCCRRRCERCCWQRA